MASLVFYIARGPHCWGRATDPRAAIRKARKELSRLYLNTATGHPTFVVHQVHPETTVTELGGLAYPRAHPPKLVGYYDLNGHAPLTVTL